MSSDKEEEVYNPMSHSSIDKILKQREEAHRKMDILAEIKEDYRDALNRIVASPDGQFVFEQILKHSGLFMFDKAFDPAKIVQERWKQSVYLEMIRPYLDKTNLMELESKCQNKMQ